ncbi:hypothetical protein [Alloactinosynnema sp. L-07]|uniref:hypothetical protein n=1 Tax=Alloactinosynnema sp. L-07 TaxID=1653480 RepID=UPI00065F021C|nr:hypothetical protein [Alloactinosynnema sp. L-07]CRK56271.1 hypothetical protein [Alloactinosynnema sp. L-07]
MTTTEPRPAALAVALLALPAAATRFLPPAGVGHEFVPVIGVVGIRARLSW